MFESLWPPVPLLTNRVAFRETCRLRDGTIGYYALFPRTDTCWLAAVSTVLQVPISEVPDPQVDKRRVAGEDPAEISRSAWDEFAAWLEGRGLRMVAHRAVPVPRRRWIGVVPKEGWFNDHCLVMSHGELLFDPVLHAPESALATLLCPTGSSLSPERLDSTGVKFGYSFQRAGSHERQGGTRNG